LFEFDQTTVPELAELPAAETPPKFPVAVAPAATEAVTVCPLTPNETPDPFENETVPEVIVPPAPASPPRFPVAVAPAPTEAVRVPLLSPKVTPLPLPNERFVREACEPLALKTTAEIRPATFGTVYEPVIWEPPSRPKARPFESAKVKALAFVLWVPAETRTAESNPTVEGTV